MNENFLAWLAGFFEGEGCFLVDIRKNGSRSTRLTIAQKNKIPLFKIMKVYGGNIWTSKRNGCSSLQISNLRNVKRIIGDIRPYLVFRGEEIDEKLKLTDNWRNSPHFTKQEEEFILNNYKTMFYKDIGKVLNRSRNSIAYYIITRGLTTNIHWTTKLKRGFV